MKNGMKVVDADAHMQEPGDLWDNYVESAFYDRRPIVEEVEHRIYYRYATSELFPPALRRTANLRLEGEAVKDV